MLEGEFLNDSNLREGGAEGLRKSSVDSKPELRFFDLLRGAILQSMDSTPPDSQAQPSVFVLAKRPRQHQGALGLQERIYDMNAKPPSGWAGRLILLAENGTTGWARPLETPEAAAALLEAEGLGGAPMAIVRPVQRTMTCFPSGTLEDEEAIRIPLPTASRPVTMQDILAVIELFRKEALLTPQVCPPSFWADKAKHAPCEEVERFIQWGVAQALRASFRPIQADIEKITSVGRIDISMIDPDRPPGAPQHPAVIELKALRSASHTGTPVSAMTNVYAAVKGHIQVAAYRKKMKAPLGLLACFDLRQAKTDILAHKSVAAARAKYFDEGLEARVFRLYANTTDAQKDEAA